MQREQAFKTRANALLTNSGHPYPAPGEHKRTSRNRMPPSTGRKIKKVSDVELCSQTENDVKAWSEHTGGDVV